MLNKVTSISKVKLCFLWGGYFTVKELIYNEIIYTKKKKKRFSTVNFSDCFNSPKFYYKLACNIFYFPKLKIFSL